MTLENQFFNCDCITGAKKYIPNNTIDLIITDPPYGIDGDNLHKHYNRNEDYVIDGYVEIPRQDYYEFSLKWIKQAERVLKPGGSIYIVSGYTNLVHILNALHQTSLKEINHIIWKYNFGVYTKNKYVSSHYHILYYVKPGKKPTFNTFCRYSDNERDTTGHSLNYQDREDVWIINREYKPGKTKNKNELPTKLLSKMILYSSNEGDLVCDFFLGGFSTAKVAIGLNRDACGFEVNKNAFEHGMTETKLLKYGWLLPAIKKPEQSRLFNQGKTWSDDEKKQLVREYVLLKSTGLTKKNTINKLSNKYGRGYFSILNVLKSAGI